MALTSGTKLGPYEIQSPLGAGGMGEVYRARDTRLDRIVAIKTLPSHLCDNPESKQRFEREARTISSLNHPHICVLHDVGSQDGISYLVMEYVRGESLEIRLQKGPLPLKQVLEYGQQICDALEKAHAAGIVHRDLKPGNIMLTASGAKLLDFGLAKPVTTLLGSQAISNQGNLTPHMPTVNLSTLKATPAVVTQQGTIVGTFQYMAPEVLQGREADGRSDIFSFGCVLYETITAKRAFEGKSQLSVLTAILEKEPEAITKFAPAIPAALDHTILVCLEKNPEDRFQSAHDVRVQLAWLGREGSSAATRLTEQRKAGKWKQFATAAIAVALAVALSLFWRPQPAPRVMRTSLIPPEGTRFSPLYRNGSPVLSPDGTRVAFIANRDGKLSLWVRSLDKLEANELPGTEGAYFPFWSPDGRSLGFFARGKLWRMDANGGSLVAICNAMEGRGASWGKWNEILFDGDGSSMSRISADGGTSVAVTSTIFTPSVSMSDRWPYFLPDGKHFLYLHSPTGAGDDRNEIRFASTDGKLDKVLLKGRYYVPEYASGWLLVARGNALMAQRFDPDSGELHGSALQVADNLQVDDNVAGSVFSVSQNGELIYMGGSLKGTMFHVWLDARGEQLKQANEPGVYGAVRISPDETKFAGQVYGNGHIDIAIWDLVGGTRTQVASGRLTDTPVWSADGRTLYYSYSGDDKPAKIYSRPVDGSGEQRSVIATEGEAFPTDVSSDGRWLVYQEAIPNARQFSALKAFPLAGGGQPITVIERIDGLSSALLMPGRDHGWVAYQSSESGRPEIYLTRFPNAGAKYQVSPGGGMMPVWSKDGKRLYFQDAEQRLNAVDIRIEKGSVQTLARTTLFPSNLPATFDESGYDITRNGRFLMMKYVTETAAPMTLVTNWNAELRK
jgi:eukaryotic-like serine/threonine-protein kinase